MCFVLALVQMHPRYPLVVAANRDEARARPSRPPHRWPGKPAIWAGRDEVAGGTWLGVNDRGVLAAITNRRRGDNDPSLPSRGGLCLGVLQQESTQAAAAYVEAELTRSHFNPFNLLCASITGGWVTTWQADKRPLGPGAHILTNQGDLDDKRLSMVKRGHELIAEIEVPALDLDALLEQLGRICADTEGASPICRPGGERGTVSSSLIALGTHGRIAAYRHADGPPCGHRYRDAYEP